MISIRQRYRNWLHWRRLVRQIPNLPECWKIVAASHEFRCGYIGIDAEVIKHSSFNSGDHSNLRKQTCFKELVAEFSAGASAVLVIHLAYPVADKRNDRIQNSFYIALPSLRLLGKAEGYLCGY